MRVKLLEGTVATVTGAGRGLGREEALLLRQLGAWVVVNDRGVEWDGTSSDDRPATLVAEEIRAGSWTAMANYSDVASAGGARELLDQAIDEFGSLDILVNNAGILRDGMVFSIDPGTWNAVIEVHLYRHFLTTRWAWEYWRTQAKTARDGSPMRSLILTSAASGLFGNASQTNINVAKTGIVGLTIAAAKELRKSGVTCNAIAPRARTRMTSTTFETSTRAGDRSQRRGIRPDGSGKVAPLVAYLASRRRAMSPAGCSSSTSEPSAEFGCAHFEATIVKPGRWPVEQVAERTRNCSPTYPPITSKARRATRFYRVRPNQQATRWRTDDPGCPSRN